MFDITSQTFQFNNITLWIDLAITVAMFVVVLFTCFKIFTRKIDFVLTSILVVCTIVFWFFGFQFAWVVTIILNTGICASIFTNQHAHLNSIFRRGKKNKPVFDKIYDRQSVVQQLSIAVDTLSKTKTGALITLEKQDKLNDVVKSGTILNAPISPELLTTIFYPGTRLHDGAVVIRRDEILAASVYYTPTTKPLTGKYGSRHRAALGISEKTDSVTIVVSEETGRISIAYKGELIPVAHDNFLRTLEEYLMEEAE